MKTVEDCLEILAGMQVQNGEFKIERSDFNLVTSLARQTLRGVPYTDRQCQLAKEKVLQYRTQFESNGYNIDVALEELRLPLRRIDRSRWIKIVEHPKGLNVTSDDKTLWIAIRFIFQKKLINGIDAIKHSLGDGFYDKENKIHYFPLNEITVYKILSVFNKSNNFEVEEQLEKYYETMVDMDKNKENYVPGIYGLKLKNLHEKSFQYAISSIGEPDIHNLCHYYDQKERFGLYHFDDDDLATSLKSLSPLAKKIAQRTKNQILISSKEYTLDNLVEAVLELYRFPLLVVLEEKYSYDELTAFHKAFNGIIPNESCSVLFRLDNDAEGVAFNQYIKKNNLNNKVDNNTKIVYISNNKVPKPLLQSDWFPNAAITTTSGKSYGIQKLDSYLSTLDLVMHHDSEVGPWKSRFIESI